MGTNSSSFKYRFCEDHQRSWHIAYIALGSNIGDKKAYLDMAVEHLNERKDCQVKKSFPLPVTAPYGVTDQDDFLNGALELQTILDPGKSFFRFFIR